MFPFWKHDGPDDSCAMRSFSLQDAYIVPKDFTTNKLKYGPLAGQTVEERLLVNYESGTLPLRNAKAKRTILCLECAGAGHKARDCPSVFA